MESQNFLNHETESITNPVETVSNKTDWFTDDFENQFKKTTPHHRSLIVYRPKEKKRLRFFNRPVVAAVISSVVTCILCFTLFAAVYKPERSAGSVLPPTGSISSNLGGYRVQQLATDTSKADGIPEIYDAVSPAVVSILCKSSANGYVQSKLSSGSGIILRQDGYIVTNNHVIDGAAEITVTTIAGQNIEATVVGKDSRTDLAVLKIKSDTPLPFAELGDSSQIRVGEMALAIGNPLREELAGTLTVGYISAINRSMLIDGKQMTMIQTDAAINPGNSGGALLNMKGQVIGINTAKSTGYDVEGLGFAIPANEARPIIESIIKHGYVTGRVVIGVQGQSITEAIAKANNLPIGVYIKGIVASSAAEKAGLRTGDVILSCDNQKVTTIDEINKIRDTHKVGETMSILVDRNGQKLNFSVTLQEEKPNEEPAEQQQQQQLPQQYQQQIPFPFSWFGW